MVPASCFVVILLVDGLKYGESESSLSRSDELSIISMGFSIVDPTGHALFRCVAARVAMLRGNEDAILLLIGHVNEIYIY